MNAHTLTLSLVGDDYDPNTPDFWDQAELDCPHDPPTAGMPCAVWDLCGCKPKRDEIYDLDWGTGSGPCPTSGIGIHHYVEGEPQRPLPGVYLVEPRCVNDALQLHLVTEAVAS